MHFKRELIIQEDSNKARLVAPTALLKPQWWYSFWRDTEQEAMR